VRNGRPLPTLNGYPTHQFEQWFLCAFKILAQQVVKRMGWTLPVQNFPGPISAHGLHTLDLTSREAIELRACGKELAQQPVGVLGRAPLPRTRRMGQVDAHLGLRGEEPMFPHLLALVIRERAAEWDGQRPHFAGEGPPHSGGIFRRQWHQQGNPGGPFHQRPQCRRVGMPHQQGPLPMAGHRAIGDLGGPFVATTNVLDGTRRETDRARPTKAVAPPQIPGKGALEGIGGQHLQIGVDGFVRDAHRRVIWIPLRQPVGDLLRRPPVCEEPEDRGAQARMDRQFSGFPRLVGPALGALMRRDRSIGHGRGVMACALTEQGARRSAEHLANGAETMARSQQATQLFAFEEAHSSIPSQVQLLGSWFDQETGVALES